jgi:co-chaperonin GroES (HSP10)
MSITASPIQSVASQSILDAWPAADPGIAPFGSRVLVQLRQAKKFAGTRGIIHISDETRDAEKWNTQVAKVIALGPVAFKNRTTLEPWPENDWCQPGDFVRVAKHGGDRFEVPMGTEGGDKALFAIFNDLELIGRVTGDPLKIIAFI